MYTQNNTVEKKEIAVETLETFISDSNIHPISKKARYTGFQYRSKVEFLRFFIV